MPLIFKNLLLLISSATIDTPRSGWFDHKCCSDGKEWYPETEATLRKRNSSPLKNLKASTFFFLVLHTSLTLQQYLPKAHLL